MFKIRTNVHFTHYFSSCDGHIAVSKDGKVTGGTLGHTHHKHVVAHDPKGICHGHQIVALVKVTEVGNIEFIHSCLRNMVNI